MRNLELWRSRGIGYQFFWWVCYDFGAGAVVWEGGPDNWTGVSKTTNGIETGLISVQKILKRESHEAMVGCLNKNRQIYDVMWSIVIDSPEGELT